MLPSRLVKTSITHAGSELIAFVSPVTFDTLFGPDQRKDDEERRVCYQAVFKKVPGPVDPTKNPDSVSPTQAPSARVLKAGSSEKTKGTDQTGAEEPKGSGDVYIGCSSSIIDKHIVFAALTEGLEEWDTVRYVHIPLVSVPSSSAAILVSLLN